MHTILLQKVSYGNEAAADADLDLIAALDLDEDLFGAKLVDALALPNEHDFEAVFFREGAEVLTQRRIHRITTRRHINRIPHLLIDLPLIGCLSKRVS